MDVDVEVIKSQQLQAMLAECAREPIRSPGMIQPHGALLVVNRADLGVTCVSDNCAHYLGVDANAALGRPLSASVALTPEALTCLTAPGYGRSGLFPVPGRELALLLHVGDETALLEFQPLARPMRDWAHLPDDNALALSAIHGAPDASSAIEAAVSEVQRIVGYQRVMAYRFDSQWNGQVIAERAPKEITPYLGLCYPASDIPEQARALYAQNWLRVIPDVSYVPVPLRACAPEALSSLDLSDAVLRSVSPVHIEYLKNLGVGASLSISLRCNGSLWGLIACHHDQPRHVSFALLERCVLIGCVLSAKLESEQLRTRLLAFDAAKRSITRLAASMRTDGVGPALANHAQEVLQLTQATGAAVLHRGTLHQLGRTPDEPQLRELIAWLVANACDELACAALHVHHPGARDYASSAAGLLCMRLPDAQPAFVMWFRPELVHVVNWGGNPNKPLQTETDGSQWRLGPRRSFELWQQTVHLTSQAWTDAEHEAAAELRRAIIEEDLRRQLEREQALRQSLESSNRELDRYAHVIAHDLLAPLNGIAAFSKRILRELADGKLERVNARAQSLNRAATGLAELVRSLHQYSRAGQVELAIEDTDLGALVLQELERLSPFLSEHDAEVEVDGALPTVRCDRIRVGVVLRNLISNAVRYNSRSAKRVRIYSRASHPPIICVADNGIGIPPAERDRVFGMFSRLHGPEAFGGGSGMGLAIAARIVERHGGRIWIEDGLDGGVTVAFTL